MKLLIDEVSMSAGEIRFRNMTVKQLATQSSPV